MVTETEGVQILTADATAQARNAKSYKDPNFCEVTTASETEKGFLDSKLESYEKF